MINLTVLSENILSRCIFCLQTLIHRLAISIIEILENVILDVSDSEANESIGYVLARLLKFQQPA